MVMFESIFFGMMIKMKWVLTISIGLSANDLFFLFLLDFFEYAVEVHYIQVI